MNGSGNEMTDRDESIGRALKRTLEANGERVPAGSCLDAELLAAWADGALDARERTEAELHAADCARCQAVLAAMITTMPAPAETAGSSDFAGIWSRWRRPALAWLIPVTMATAALAVWVAVPAPAPVQVSDTAATAAPLDKPLVQQGTPPAAGRDDTGANLERRAQPQGRDNKESRLEARPPTDMSSNLRARTQSAPLEQDANPAHARSNAVPEPFAPEAEALAGTASMRGAAPAAGAPAAPGATPAPSNAAPAPAATAQLQAAGSADAIAPREALSGARLMNKVNQVETIVVSSNPSTRFRLLARGGVQRSADAGATWRTEVTGVTETLTAGASPSPSVCWVVGTAGTVLLTTDGRSWRRLAFPDAGDLRSVTASDGENATVTTADGRAFTTSDAGRTWQRSGGR
jgi:hypothetical protein